MLGLQRMLETLRGLPVDANRNGSQPESVQNFFRQMFMQSWSITFGLNGDPIMSRGIEIPANPLVSKLNRFQAKAADVPPDMRRLIGRLQVPVLKAALLDQNLMQDEGHPARQLLNRLSTAAVAADPSSAAGKTLSTEIERVVDKVLTDFNADTAVFAAQAR